MNAIISIIGMIISGTGLVIGLINNNLAVGWLITLILFSLIKKKDE